VRIALAQQGEGVALTVEDTGVGISEEGLSRLFEPFTQADASTTRRFGGTGLGLVICRRLAQAMGGDIELTSKLGEGSRFRVVLPQLRAVSPPAEGNAAPSSPQPTVDSSTEEFAEEAPSAASDTCSTQDEASTPLHVLLVEDQEINQRLIARILQRQGHEFDLAVNGAEAVERCRNQHYDLVLMDCQMPILDGYAATAAIRAAEAEGAVPQRIIALTANAMSGDRERCIAAGMDDLPEQAHPQSPSSSKSSTAGAQAATSRTSKKTPEAQQPVNRRRVQTMSSPSCHSGRSRAIAGRMRARASRRPTATSRSSASRRGSSSTLRTGDTLPRAPDLLWIDIKHRDGRASLL
jgi:CheY-like chemotaxis protein